MQSCIEKLEQRMGDQFSFFLAQDSATTGRLEVTLYKDEPRSCEGRGALIWSKKQLGANPSSDWDAFVQKVMDAINE